MDTQSEPLFLSKVELGGFRTIRNLTTTFKHGINIIIGANGSGKSNVLEFLEKALVRDYSGVFGIKTSLQFGSGKILVRAASSNEIPEKGITRQNSDDFIKYNIVIGDKHYKNRNRIDANDKLDEKLLSHLFIRHGLPADIEYLESPLAFSLDPFDPWIDANEAAAQLVSDLAREIVIEFASKLESKFASFEIIGANEVHSDSIKSNAAGLLAQIFKKLGSLTTNLKGLTSISNLVPVNSGTINYNAATKKVQISNLTMGFDVDGNVIPFSSLSDGTQRLVFIVSEIRASCLFDKECEPEIILLEEPELGIHPHQLHKLMLFLKEQAETKQFIITTHSPQVLDILGIDELDRIQICSYDSIHGTQLRHLTPTEIAKAQSYMKEVGYLSDYWRFSDLEPATV